MSQGIASETSLVSRGKTDSMGSCGAGQPIVEPQQPRVSGGNGSATPGTATAGKGMNQMTVGSPRYLVIKRKDGTDFSGVSPFKIEKILYGLAGEVNSVRKINMGLLIETISKKQSLLLSKIEKFGEFDVEVTPHTQLNKSKGVIYCHDLLNCTIEEIKEGLENQGVIDIRRLKTKKNGILVDTPGHILTFNSPNLPKKIDIAIYKRVEVRPYIPPPMKCFRCQKFGHVASKCTNIEICICGKPKHPKIIVCSKPFKCPYCEGEHLSTDKRCPTYTFEKSIQEIKTLENIPYFEARKKATARTPITGVSYAQMTQTKYLKENDLSSKIIPELINTVKSIVERYLKPLNIAQSEESSEKIDEDIIIQSEKPNEPLRQLRSMLPPLTPLKIDISKQYSKRKGDQRSPLGDDADESDSSQLSQKSERKLKKSKLLPKGRQRKNQPPDKVEITGIGNETI